MSSTLNMNDRAEGRSLGDQRLGDQKARRSLDPRIGFALQQFARRRVHLAMLRGVCIVTMIFFLAFGILGLCDYLFVLGDSQRLVTSLLAYGLTIVAAGLWIMWPRFSVEAEEATAGRFEQAEPKLRNHLLSAVELGGGDVDDEVSASAGSPLLRQILQRRVGKFIATLSVKNLLPLQLIKRWIVSTIIMVASVAVLMLIPGSPVALLYARALAPTANLARFSLTRIVILNPSADVNLVPADETLLVQAEISGTDVTSARIELRWLAGETSAQAMRRLDDSDTADSDINMFVANLEIGSEPFDFRILANDAITAWRHVEPRSRPAVAEFESTIRLPEYAKAEPKTVRADDGSLTVLEGSSVDMRFLVNQDAGQGEISFPDRLSGDGVDQRAPLKRTGGDRFDYSFGELKSRDSYRVHFVASETGFESKFPKKHTMDVVEDLPPIARLAADGSTSSISPPRGLLALQMDVRDELAVDSILLEYMQNDGDWGPFPTQPSPAVDTQRSEAEKFRVVYAVAFEMDLGDVSLAEGDVLGLRIAVKDLKGQHSFSNQVRIQITSDYFTDERYALLDQRLKFTDVIRKWSEIPTGDAAIAASVSSVLATAVELLATSPAGPDAMEVEWLARSVVSLSSSSPKDASENDKKKQRIAVVADWFAAYTAAITFAGDMDAMQQYAKRIEENASGKSDAWFRRQMELLVANYQSCIGKLESVDGRFPDSANRGVRSLADQWRQLADRIESILQETGDVRRLRGEHTYQLEQLRNRNANIVLDGSIAGAAIDGLRQLDGMIDSHGRLLKPIASLLKNEQELRQRKEGLSDATEAAKLQEQLAEQGRLFSALVGELDLQLRSLHEVHAARVDVTPERLQDLDLIQKVVASVLAKKRPDVDPVAAFQDIYGATDVLDAGQQMIEMRNLLRTIAIDERWSKLPVTKRIENPRRWDYWTCGMELVSGRMRGAGVDQAIWNPMDQLRYFDPAGPAGRVISNRRWDVNWTNQSADDVDFILARYVEVSKPMELEMASARDRLRQYLPDEASGETSPEGAPKTETESKQDAPQQLASLPMIELEQLLESAKEMTAEEMLRTLEAELPKNEAMQEELAAITDEILSEAIADLERAAVQEYDSQRGIERSDPQMQTEKEMSAHELRMMAQQIDQLTNDLVQQARSVAGRAAAKDAIDQLSEAEKKLREASSTARQANDSMLAEELAQRAADVQDSLAAATEAMQQAQASANEQTQNELETEPNRKRTQDQMKSLQGRTQDAVVRGAEQISRQWNQIERSYENNEKNAVRQKEQAEKRLEKAESDAALKPDATNLQDAVRDAKRAVAEAENRANSAQAAKERANQLSESAKEAADEARKSELAPLDTLNPAASLAEQFAKQGAELASELAEVSKGIQDRLESSEGIEASGSQLAATAAEQADVQRQVNQVADALERAARHEERLGSREAGEQFQQAAESVRELANESVQQLKEAAAEASRQLQQSANPATSPEEGKAIASATEAARDAIQQQLENLNALSEQRADSAQSEGSQPQASLPSESKLKAQTLDDLDRALNSAAAAQAQQPNAEQAPTSPQESALAASSSLSEAAAQQASQQARQQPESDASNPQDANTPSSQPTDSNATADGALAPGGTQDGLAKAATSASDSETPILKSLKDWGELRERKAEQATEGSRRAVSDRYRRQIEAYFRSISDREKTQ